MHIKCDPPNDDNPLTQLVPCLKIIEQIDKCVDKEIELDMNELEWITPFSALLLSHKIIQKKNIRIIPPKKKNVQQHLSKIGFPLGETNSGNSYSPIHHFTSDAAKAANNTYELIDRVFPKTLQGNIIKYLISELCDNVDQHSQFKQASIMAQHFVQKGFIDIAVVDNGISIPKNFEIHNIPSNSDPEAISSALDGTSTKKTEGRGKGLTSSENVVQNGLKGEFYIFSRSGGVLSKYDSERILYNILPFIFNGTIVYFRFKVPNKQIDIYPYLENKNK